MRKLIAEITPYNGFLKNSLTVLIKNTPLSKLLAINKIPFNNLCAATTELPAINLMVAHNFLKKFSIAYIKSRFLAIFKFGLLRNSWACFNNFIEDVYNSCTIYLASSSIT